MKSLLQWLCAVFTFLHLDYYKPMSASQEVVINNKVNVTLIFNMLLKVLCSFINNKSFTTCLHCHITQHSFIAYFSVVLIRS